MFPHGFFQPVIYSAASWSFSDVRPASLSAPSRLPSSALQVPSLESAPIFARLRPDVQSTLSPLPVSWWRNVDSEGDPPVYTTSSPPKYAALPLTTETTLLLAPAPPYSMIHDVEANRYRRQSGALCGDRVVLLLVVLNTLVWAAVVTGYVLEWKDHGLSKHGTVDSSVSFAADLGGNEHCRRKLCTGQGCFWEDCNKFYEVLMSI